MSNSAPSASAGASPHISPGSAPEDLAHESSPYRPSLRSANRLSLSSVGAVIFGIILLCLPGCHLMSHQQQTEPAPIQPEMRDAYAVTSKLFGYVWDPVAFEDKKNEKTIDDLLVRLSGDFHRVEKKAPLSMFEPGFAVTLQTNREMIHDIRRRFAAGSKDYAMWRLRSLSETCISCHSRYNAPTDFVGSPPQPTEDSSFESRLGAAQFLFATRQFDRAADDLFALARSVGAVKSGGQEAVHALKLWLMIQVRVKNRYAEAARELDLVAPKLHIGPYPPMLLRSWAAELRQLEKPAIKHGTPLETAQLLLSSAGPLPDFVATNAHGKKHGKKARGAKNNRDSASTSAAETFSPANTLRTEDDDLMILPRTLRASALLHQLLPTEQRPDIRRRASYLLAFAYLHMPIQELAVFRELYLEQCIREFPGSDEAKEAYRWYEDLVRDSSTGSGGVHLDEEDQQKLNELKQLAQGGPTV